MVTTKHSTNRKGTKGAGNGVATTATMFKRADPAASSDGAAMAVKTLLNMEAASRPGWGWSRTDSEEVLYKAIRELSLFSAAEQRRFAEVLNGYLGGTLSGAGEPNLAYYIRRYLPGGEDLAARREAVEGV